MIASIFWLASLALPGITAYRGSYIGFLILLLGWMSLNPAWFANLFIGYAFFRISVSAKSAPVVSILVASTLSLFTFQMNIVPTDEGGGTSPIYGYGVGAVFWFISICLYWIATSLRVRELNSGTSEIPTFVQNIFHGFGIFMLFVVTAGSIGLGIADRIGANTGEKKHLEITAFKRGKICRVENFDTNVTPPMLNGPIEVSGSPGDRYDYYFWKSPLDFLEWGARVVRVSNVDYQYINTPQGTRIQGTVTKGESFTHLDITALPYNSIDLKISLPNQTTPALNYHWTLNHENNVPCPDISIENPPKKIILNFLGLKEPDQQEKKKEPEPVVYKQISGIEKGGLEIIFGMINKCPDEISALPDFQNRHPEAKPLGAAIKINEKIRFFPEIINSEVKPFCSGDFVYLVHKEQVGIDHGFQITKISLHDMKIEWHLFSPLPYNLTLEKPIAINETEQKVRLALTLSDRTDPGRKNTYALLNIDTHILKNPPTNDLSALVSRQTMQE